MSERKVHWEEDDPRVKPQPYVGVSGVGSMQEQGAVIDAALDTHIHHHDRFTMLGIQATTKTQLLEVANSRGRRWHPVGEELTHAAGNEDSGITKVFMHCFFEPENLEAGVEVVMRRSRNYARGVQLNMLPWMSRDYRKFLDDFKAKYPYQAVVLQAHADGVINEHSPAAVAQRLQGLPVDYVLFDASHGFGKELDSNRLRAYVDAVYQLDLPISVVVAGGLEAGNLEELLGALLQEFPDLSFDAEGRLRRGDKGQTRLDTEAVRAYLRAAKQLLL